MVSLLHKQIELNQFKKGSGDRGDSSLFLDDL